MSLDFMLAVTFAGFLAIYFQLVFALTANRVGVPRLDFTKGTAEFI
jgi:hypothetical protein